MHQSTKDTSAPDRRTDRTDGALLLAFLGAVILILAVATSMPVAGQVSPVEAGQTSGSVSH